MATPAPFRHRRAGKVKKTLRLPEPLRTEFVSQSDGFFRRSREIRNHYAGRRIDAARDYREYGHAGVIEIASEGQVLVSSTTERRSAKGDGKGAKSSSPRKGRDADAKNDGNVSQVLRTVYQRAVDEAVPAEMLDLLSKLD